MHDSEANIIPYQASPVLHARAVLVFAPHPDDEIFGCGGALLHHIDAGHTVHVVLLTAGEFQSGHDRTDSYSASRLQESAIAANTLGLPPPECWAMEDRAVRYGEPLIERMLHAIQAVKADVVYAPSLWELHPDHRSTALAAIESVRRIGKGVTLFLYEVSAALRPNMLVDVTSVWARKLDAMSAFASQEMERPYASFVTSLNRFRALTLYPAAEYAEGFERIDAETLKSSGSVSLIEGERKRLLNRGIVVLPKDIPLVSIVVRSMGRPTLSRALASIDIQTYRNIEVVLVDAAGEDSLYAFIQEQSATPIRKASYGRRLPRSEAANLGLQSARGEYLIFLDDDDWFYPDHVSKLVHKARMQPEYLAVHTDVECVDSEGKPSGRVFDFKYAQGELCYGNFLPIHSVLFHRDLVGRGCCFDCTFDLYEDWDFWLQVEKFTPINYVPGVSAAYRVQLGSGEGVRAERNRAVQATKQIFSKWKVMQSENTFGELVDRALSRRVLIQELKSVDMQLKSADMHLSAARQEMQSLQQTALAAQREADRSRQDADHFRKAHDLACFDRDALRKNYEDLVGRYVVLQSQWAEEYARRFSLESAGSNYRNEIERLQNELILARNHSDNLQISLDGTKKALDLARNDIGALLSSTSWKVSRPVRKLGAVLIRAKQSVALIRQVRGQGRSWVAIAQGAIGVYQRGGWSGFKNVMRNKLDARFSSELIELKNSSDISLENSSGRDYPDWVLRYDALKDEHLEKFRAAVEGLCSRPKISIVMPVYAPQKDDLFRAIASVRAQIYPYWELCICDDASPDVDVRNALEDQAKSDSRIKLIFHEKNKHISAATNSAISLATGDYIAFLDHDDELRPHALLNVVQGLECHPAAEIFYSDEDKIDGNGQRFDPYFKPGFNLGLLRSHNYMCHFAVYRSSLIHKLGGLRVGFEGAQDYDLVLRAVDIVNQKDIVHIPKILYHWRTALGSTAAGHENKKYAHEAGRRALAEHLQRRKLQGEIGEAPEAPGMYRVHWQRPEPVPLVSIIIPTRNGHDILKQCLDSLTMTTYPHYEVIVIDNGSDDHATLQLLTTLSSEGRIRVLSDERPFNFSALNNRAVRELALGEFVLLMNNDIEVTHPEWLDEMVGPAMEPGVGCVGARLWYPDGRLQHGGVVLVCGVAGHAHKFLPRGMHGYMGRAVLAQDFVAVTAACLLVRRAIYDEVGGLDESLAVAFNDVDFCLKVHQAGYRNHWTPYAELVHHESLTRGYEDTPEKQARFKGEIDILQSRWSHLLQCDPCYNPNLTADAEDFSLAWPPRVSLTGGTTS